MKKLGVFSIVTSAVILAVALGEECPHKMELGLGDPDFSSSLTHYDILKAMTTNWAVDNYFKSWVKRLEALKKDTGSTIQTNNDKFQISLDVKNFSPEEITVKISDGYVVIEAKHEEKQDDQLIVSRQFERKYALPKGVESENVVSELSSDRILTVIAPRKVVDEKGVRIVPITMTGPIRKEPKDEEHSCNVEDMSCNNV